MVGGSESGYERGWLMGDDICVKCGAEHLSIGARDDFGRWHRWYEIKRMNGNLAVFLFGLRPLRMARIVLANTLAGRVCQRCHIIENRRLQRERWEKSKMARCEDCGKFVSYGDSEIDIQDGWVEGDTFTAQVEVTLTCESCGKGLKQATLDLERKIEHECGHEPKEGDRYEVLHARAEGTKNVLRGRGNLPRTFYGADLTFTVRCNWCGRKFNVSAGVQGQASEYESL